MRLSLCCFLLPVVLSGFWGGPGLWAQEGEPEKITATPSGLRYVDLKAGTGKPAKKGAEITINYIVWLDDHGKKGKEVVNTLKSGARLAFVLGETTLIPGLEEGLHGLNEDGRDDMKMGGKRLIYIPAGLAYGSEGAGKFIPPDADLIFEVEIIHVE
jgi:FKBP-type peptidyl-prolyl cis-trans isomerase